MKTGVSYIGHYNPKHIRADIEEMCRLGLDDVLVGIQENDFVYFPGKLDFTPQIAREKGLRPVAIFWGALNLFGGGRSSQFLLEHPECFQVAEDGSHRPGGCYVNPVCVARIEEMIDRAVEAGFEGYFVDEPTPLRECFCLSCRERFEEWYGGDLAGVSEAQQDEFRQRCVVDYTRRISDYCRANHPDLETMCCIMPVDESVWEAAAGIGSLDNLGTDLYWVNNDRDVEEMRPILRGLDGICKKQGKIHHEWLQCWHAKRGTEDRILQQGRVLIEEKPDALYVWAWEAQIGTAETCDDPEKAWSKAREVFRLAKEG